MGGVIALIGEPTPPLQNVFSFSSTYKLISYVSAVCLRFIIPESPRYYSGIQKDLKKAVRAMQQVGGRAEDVRSELSVSSGVANHSHRTEEPIPWARSTIKYLKEGGWKPLVGMSLIWLLLDVCFHGTSLDSPATLNALWMDSAPLSNGTREPDWNTDRNRPDATIQQMLIQNSQRSLLLSSIASLAGSLLAIPLVYVANRMRLLIGTSLALTLLFIATGASVVTTFAKPDHKASMVFFALAQCLFNLGPNTLIFILPPEIFPTIFRGTFYGISAAAGKLGAIIIRAIVATSGDQKNVLTAYLFVFAGLMLLLVVIALLPVILP